MRAMKDSGVDWIGEIPADWGTRKIKYDFRVINGSTPKSNEEKYWNGNIVWITPSEMGGNERIFHSTKTITDEGLHSCGTTIVSKNTLILSTRAPIGKINIAGVDLCTNQGCKSLVCKGTVYYKYTYYYLLTQIETLNMLGRGTTFFELSTFDLHNFVECIPTYNEQQRIAAYLDARCAKIDTLISQEQVVIEKLKEYKQALITRAVTKGLDPDVPMKDSGVDWIGEIPADWEIKRLKHVADLDIHTLSECTLDDTLIKYIDISSVSYDSGIVQTQELSFNDAPSRARRILKTGDTIISTVRTYLKAIAYIMPEYNNYICSTGFAVYTPHPEIFGKYLYYSLCAHCFISMVEAYSVGISYPAINSSSLSNLNIVLASYKEQHRIVAYIDARCAAIDATISKKQTLIDKLTEYKKSLIYEVVTGKKEV